MQIYDVNTLKYTNLIEAFLIKIFKIPIIGLEKSQKKILLKN